MPIICEGCGQRVAIPDGYRRNKIQCACGVICAVPESAHLEAEAAPKRPARKPRAVEEDAERWLLDDDAPASPPESETPIFHDAEPVEEPEPPPRPAVFERRYPCRRCGRLVRRQGECPDCNPDAVPTAAKQEQVWWPSVDEPNLQVEEEEDSSPYGVVGAEEVKCPKCCFMLPPASVLCVRCGFHFQKRKKIAKTYQPIERVWETTAACSSRLMIFGSCEAAFAGLGLAGVLWGGAAVGPFVGSFAVVTLMLAFLLGTFDRIRLMRDPRGLVQLTKTWRVAFFALAPRTIDVRAYEGVASGRHRPVSAWDSWILYVLIVFGIIPGLIWWYLVFYKITYHVALSRDHGFPAYTVYSGGSLMQMKEIAYALRDASGLRYDEG